MTYEEVVEQIAFQFFKYHYKVAYHKEVNWFAWNNDYGWAKRQYEEQAEAILSLKYPNGNRMVAALAEDQTYPGQSHPCPILKADGTTQTSVYDGEWVEVRQEFIDAGFLRTLRPPE